MDTMLLKMKKGLRKCLPLLPAVCLIIMLGLAISSPMKVTADAGGWPTATPTLTQLPPTATQVQETPAALPTLPEIIFPPTNTPTPLALGLIEGGAIPQVVMEDEPAPNRNITALLCWPLGIILVVGTFLALILLRNRIVASAP
jgi:hypothetical protein